MTNEPKPTVLPCPSCGAHSHTVPGQTVKALLAVSLRTLTSNAYWFCANPKCPVVYFAADTLQVFTTSDLRVTVYQKAREQSNTPICYCFGHTVGSVDAQSPEAVTLIVKDITQGIRADQCACDLRNPQGSCCLGNVRQYLRKREETHTEGDNASM